VLFGQLCPAWGSGKKFELDSIPTGLYDMRHMRATAARAPATTRQKILEAAFEEFYKNGFQGGSLNRIVEKADTTKGALFHHFDGKNDLGYAVVDEVIEPEMKTRWFNQLSKSSDPIADLKRVFRRYRIEELRKGQLVQGCPLNNLAQEMSPLDEGFRQRIDKIYAAWRKCIADAVRRGIKAGKVRKGVSPETVAAFVVAAQAGMIGTAKNAQSEELLTRAGQGLFDFLETLRP
jgi:TetR/AcrR family transcriptional regulator, transcriptional repressor for nem operon